MKLKIPEYITNFKPYPLEMPIEEIEKTYGKLINLASNEAPFAALSKTSDSGIEVFGKVQAAILKSLTNINRYPDSSHFYLRNKLAEKLSITSDQIIIGNGSNELIDMLIRAFCNPNTTYTSNDERLRAENSEHIIYPKFSFIVYKLCAQIHGISSIEAPIDEETMTVDLNSLSKTVNAKTKIIFLANPNNPTGTYVETSEIEKFIERHQDQLIVLDYAYYEYISKNRKDKEKSPSHFCKYENVIVLQTFSKAYGLAGFRVGYAYGNQKLIEAIYKIKQPFNISAPALAAAEAVLSENEYLDGIYNLNKQGLEYFEKEFTRLRVDSKIDCKTYKSEANFILFALNDKYPDFHTKLINKGVFIRSMAGYGYKNHYRMNTGTMNENKIAMTKIKELLVS